MSIKKIILVIFFVLFGLFPCYAWPTKGVSVSMTVPQYIPDSVVTVIEWNAVDISIDSSWDAWANSWKPGITGWASVRASVFFGGVIIDGQNFEFHLYRNGESFKSFHMASSGHGHMSVPLNVDWYADNAGDIYDLRVFQRNTQGIVLPLNFSGGIVWTQTCYASFSIKD